MTLAAESNCRIDRFKKFFTVEDPGKVMLNVNCWDLSKEWIQKIRSGDYIDIPDPMTEEFLAQYSFQWGQQSVRDALSFMAFHLEHFDDNFCSNVEFHPGAGYQAAMSTGGDVIFCKGLGASYTAVAALDDWDRMDTVFSHENKWIDYALEFWRGVDSMDSEGLVFTPRFNRSPLDLANDLRGDRLFTDFYDYPDEVTALVDTCADSILEIDRILRSQSRTLREGPGGALGVAVGQQTVLLNGDPLDLISDEMVLRFNNPAIEKITASVPAVFLHHHSIGIERAEAVSRIKGLTVHQITQDPNSSRIPDCISDELITASLRCPVSITFSGADVKTAPEAFIERILQGRFILDLYVDSIEEGQRWVKAARSR